MERVMATVEDIVKDYFEYYDEEYYESLRKRYPEYAREWIADIETKKRIAVELITLASQGMPYTKIAQKVSAPYRLVLKFGHDIYPRYSQIVQKNVNKLKATAGDIRSEKEQDDYAYITDPRTVLTEMNVLLPRIEEIKGLLNEG
jgi:hypothetical protein